MDVNEDAPVVAASELEIDADPETVWDVLTDFDRWPSWNPDVKSISFDGDVAEGSQFRWKAGASRITSTIRRVERPRLIGWTGKTLGAQAVHVYRLERREGKTLVRTEESFDGFVVRALRGRMQKTLERSLEAGLRHLKAEAERRSPAKAADRNPRPNPKLLRARIAYDSMSAMERRRLAWLLCLPLAAIGGFSAHVVAYSWVGPTPRHSGHAAPQSAHAYLAHWRLCLAVCLAMIAVSLVAYAVRATRAAQTPRIPIWVFGLLPPAGFVAQEHLERLLASGAISPTTVLEPTFLVGLALQVPFAVAAFLVARALLTFAVAVARALSAAVRAPLVAEAAQAARVWGVELPRLAPLALGHGQRGPPSLVGSP